jgi:hypothetical protein
MSEIQKQVADNEIIPKEALQMSNYNQQYSRKFNIKIMNYPEKKDEKIRDIFVKDIVKDKLNVKVDPSEIQAIHRIPGKIGEARPVIVKLVNSEVKYRIMRAKKNLPKKETVISYFFVFLLRIVHDFDVKFPGVLLVIIRHL